MKGVGPVHPHQMKPSIQTLLRIGVPRGKRVFPSQFRELLAKQPGLPNELFHRDEAGQTKNERPGIRVAGAVGWIGLVADPGFESHVYSAAQACIQVATQLSGQPAAVGIEQHEFGLRPSNEPIRYWIREMTLKRRHKRALEKSVEDLISERALQAINATCSRYGFDCPTDEQLGVMVVQTHRPRGMYLQTTSGVTEEAVTLVDAEVLIHANLKGLWFAGNLTSRGYGRIIPSRPGMSLGYERDGEVLK